MPNIDFVLLPGDAIELTVNIKISDRNENHVELYEFEFYTDRHGNFGDTLEATIEVVPNELSQEAAL